MRILWVRFDLLAALSESLQSLGLDRPVGSRYHPDNAHAAHSAPLLVMTSPHPASPSIPPVTGGLEGHERLVEQLHTLTQVVETMTYRLLELEERLVDQESKLQDLQQLARGSRQLSDGAELRFDDTEERLVRLESLLKGADSSSSAGPSRHLQPVRGRQQSQLEAADQSPTIDGPFLEEPEQPFMDDLETHDPQLDLENLTA